MFSKRSKLAALLMAVVLPLTACDDSVTTSESGELSILLTDAPGDFHAAVVTIDAIYLQGTLGDDGSRVFLMEEPVTQDLLELSNDVRELVDGAEVPTGTYAQLRFIVSGAYIEVEGEDGETRIFASPGYEDQVPADRDVDGTLQLPSFAQTGIQVTFPGGAIQVTGTQRILLVDFNVAESFGQEAGQAGMWVMTPVIRAEDLEFTSSVTVHLALGDDVELPGEVELSDFTAHLADESGNKKEDAFEEGAEGEFSAAFPYMMPGEIWALDLEAPEGISVETDPSLPLDVTTVSGTNVEVELTITSVEETSNED